MDDHSLTITVPLDQSEDLNAVAYLMRDTYMRENQKPAGERDFARARSGVADAAQAAGMRVRRGSDRSGPVASRPSRVSTLARIVSLPRARERRSRPQRRQVARADSSSRDGPSEPEPPLRRLFRKLARQLGGARR